MEIQLNGESKTISSATLAELIETTGLDTGGLIAEVNREIVKQLHWDKTVLAPGDQVELLSFVGGG